MDDKVATPSHEIITTLKKKKEKKKVAPLLLQMQNEVGLHWNQKNKKWAFVERICLFIYFCIYFESTLL
jgi:hypothetical protein